MTKLTATAESKTAATEQSISSATDLSSESVSAAHSYPQQFMPEQQYTAAPLRPSQAQQSSSESGLPTSLKSGIEGLSGYSMSDVAVHYNSPKPSQLGAEAYAQGSQIHLSAGKEHHLPHEAWHVVQQMQGRVSASTQFKGLAINDDPALEMEADVMGERALQYSGAPGQLRTVAINSAQQAAQCAAGKNTRYKVGKKGPAKNTRKYMLGRAEEYIHLRMTSEGLKRQRTSKGAVGNFRPMTREAEKALFVESMHRQAVAAEKRRRQAEEKRDVEQGGEMANLMSEVVIDHLGVISDLIRSGKITTQEELDKAFASLQEVYAVNIDNYQAQSNGDIVVTFSINPTYQVRISGGNRIGLQMLGTDTSNTNSTKVQWEPSTLTLPANTTYSTATSSAVGYKMHASPLSQDHQKGMVAGQNKISAAQNTNQNIIMHKLAKKMGDKETKYIKGHLLNDHLGGPALPDNLFPITDEANAKHTAWVEKYVKADVAAGYVCDYKVQIDPNPTGIVPGWQTVTKVHKDDRSGYTVKSKIRCEFSRLNLNQQPIPASKQYVEIQSEYGQGAGGFDPTDATTSAALSVNNRYGAINQGETNPTTVNSVYSTQPNDNTKEAVYAPGGYNQYSKHSAKMSDLNTFASASNFTFMHNFMDGFSAGADLRTLTKTQINAVVNNQTTAQNIIDWLATHSGPKPLTDLKDHVAGVGAATLVKMQAAQWVIK